MHPYAPQPPRAAAFCGGRGHASIQKTIVCGRVCGEGVLVVSVLQWRKVLLPFSVFSCCCMLIFSLMCRLWPDCTTSLLRYKLENRLSLGGVLCRRFVAVQTRKPRLFRWNAAPLTRYGTRQNTRSSRKQRTDDVRRNEEHAWLAPQVAVRCRR